MLRDIKPWWWLQALVRNEVKQFAGADTLIPVVQPVGDAIWDEECDDVGRCAWQAGFLSPEGPLAPEIMAQIKAAIAPLQQQYDLGLTAA